MPATPSAQDILNSITTTEAPSSLQRRTEYNAENLPLYIGFAPYGFASSANVWTIFKLTYSAENLETLKQTALRVAWDDRASVGYA
jgi:hypothetical protein